MRYYITDQCDNCMECAGVCPCHAIHPAGTAYVLAGEECAPLSFHTPFIVQEECDGCVERGAPECVQACAPRTIYTNMLE